LKHVETAGRYQTKATHSFPDLNRSGRLGNSRVKSLGHHIYCFNVGFALAAETWLPSFDGFGFPGIKSRARRSASGRTFPFQGERGKAGVRRPHRVATPLGLPVRQSCKLELGQSSLPLGMMQQ
jgi:hypothetical protein